MVLCNVTMPMIYNAISFLGWVNLRRLFLAVIVIAVMAVTAAVLIVVGSVLSTVNG